MGYDIEWKRVKDELPPEGKDVLLQFESGEMYVGDRINCFRFEISSNGIDYPLDEVYAWTYLPERCLVKHDKNTRYISDEQFLGCICNTLIELGKTTLYTADIDKPMDIVFAKLYNNNIIANFYYGDMLEIINSKFSNCFGFFMNRITLDKKIYIEHFKNWYLKDIDTDVQEKTETYLKEYFIDRNGKSVLD